MDPRIEGRRRAIAEDRARVTLRRLLRVVVASLLVAGALWALRSPFFSVDVVAVSGAGVVDVEAVLAEAGVRPGVPLVEVDAGAAESLLLADPWVEKATVSRVWPDRVEVAVTERVAVGWAETTSGWARIAADGVILGEGTPPEGAARVVGAGATAEDLAVSPRVAGAAAFLAALPPELATGAVVDVGGEELVATVAGFPVRLGPPEDMIAKASALAAVLVTAPAPGSEIVLLAPSRPAVLPPEG